MKSGTVAVTGAGGFIGTSLLRLLAGRHWSIRALIGPPGFQGGTTLDGVESFTAEIDDRRAMADLVEGVDAVIHIAGLPSVADSFQRPAEHARVHVGGTATLLEACGPAGVKRLVYLSSAEVYGWPETEPVMEHHRLQARSPYGAAKITAERFIEAHVGTGAGEAVVLRPFSVYGPGQPKAGLLNTIITQAGKEDRIRLANLSPVRDYSFVDDVADAIERAVTVPLNRPLTVINIGSGRGTSVRELAEKTLEAMGRNMAILETGEHDRPVKADIPRLVADPGRAARRLNWQAVTGLEQGLRATISEAEGAA